MENRKLNEGLELVRQAEKHLKTSLFKWKPDQELAAQAYADAATCFKNAKAHLQCQDALLKAAECHKETRSYFSAAKCVDQAIAVNKDLKEFGQIANLAHQACNLYLEHGSPETAAASLDKAAKIIAKELPDEALGLYVRAAEVVDNEDRPRDAAEFIGKAAKAMVDLKRYDDAEKALLKEMGHHQAGGNNLAVGRCTVALVLVHLAREDMVEARKVFENWASSCDHEEVMTLSQLIQGYDEEDPDLVRQGLASPFIRSMDVAYSKLARDLPVPKGMEGVIKAAAAKRPKPAVEPTVVSSSGPVPSLEEDEDDELGRLAEKMEANTFAEKKLETKSTDIAVAAPPSQPFEEEEDEDDLK